MSENPQLTFEDDPIYQRYKDTFPLIRKGEFQQAYSYFNNIVTQNIDIPGIFLAMKCLKFWVNREEKISSLKEGVEKAEYINSQWKEFEEFVSAKSLHATKIIGLIKEAVFNNIIDNYIHQFQNMEVSDVELLIKISESFLNIKNYKKAKDTLLYAKKFKAKDSRILAYLGEVYFFLKSELKAMAYFREAFFHGPLEIDISRLHCPYILEIASKVRDKGFINKEVNLWLPIFAEIHKKFLAKKKLSTKDFEILQKKVYKLEIQFEINTKKRNELEPILINHYIFLLDQNKVENSENSANQTKNILRKLKNLNEGVYINLRNLYE